MRRPHLLPGTSPFLISWVSWSCWSRADTFSPRSCFRMASTATRPPLRRKLKSPNQNTPSNRVVTSAGQNGKRVSPALPVLATPWRQGLVWSVARQSHRLGLPRERGAAPAAGGVFRSLLGQQSGSRFSRTATDIRGRHGTLTFTGAHASRARHLHQDAVPTGQPGGRRACGGREAELLMKAQPPNGLTVTAREEPKGRPQSGFISVG